MSSAFLGIYNLGEEWRRQGQKQRGEGWGGRVRGGRNGFLVSGEDPDAPGSLLPGGLWQWANPVLFNVFLSSKPLLQGHLPGRAIDRADGSGSSSLRPLRPPLTCPCRPVQPPVSHAPPIPTTAAPQRWETELVFLSSSVHSPFWAFTSPPPSPEVVCLVLRSRDTQVPIPAPALICCVSLDELLTLSGLR